MPGAAVTTADRPSDAEPSPPAGVPTIRVARLTLSNYRNIESATLELEPGLTVFHGDNGQGKSNLLEAVYLLSVARSARASADRSLVNSSLALEGGHAQVLAVAREGDAATQVQVDFEVTAPQARSGASGDGDPARATVQKSLRVNGVQRTAAEFVGAFNAVSFTAEDIALVTGAPGGRRRYLNILISQGDAAYLRTLQRYGRVVQQRNHLLRRVRDRQAGPDELAFWDERLAEEGAVIIERRSEVVEQVAVHARDAHERLAGNSEPLGIEYRPRMGPGEPPERFHAARIADTLSESIAAVRDREISQGASVVGPHRDELTFTLDGDDAGVYASRGQARTVALALKLAEAAFVARDTGRRPVLALDDVLSELDAVRRRLVLEAVREYEQILLTTTDLDRVDDEFLSNADCWQVSGGEVSRLEG